MDALFQFGRSLFSECKRNNITRHTAAAAVFDWAKQRYNPLSHHFSLAGPGAGNQLKITRYVCDRSRLSLR